MVSWAQKKLAYHFRRDDGKISYTDFEDHIHECLVEAKLVSKYSTPGASYPASEYSTREYETRPDIVGYGFVADVKAYYYHDYITEDDVDKLVDDVLEQDYTIGIFITPKGVEGVEETVPISYDDSPIKKYVHIFTVYWNGPESYQWIDDIMEILLKFRKLPRHLYYKRFYE